MKDWTGTDLAREAAVHRATKKPIVVPVEFAPADGVLATREGNVAYRAGDAILTGVRDERWPMQRHKFFAWYTPLPPTREGERGRYVRKPGAVWAKRMEEDFEVRVGWQSDRLSGKPGDWLLQYGPGDYSVVTAGVFEETYDVE